MRGACAQIQQDTSENNGSEMISDWQIGITSNTKDHLNLKNIKIVNYININSYF